MKAFRVSRATVINVSLVGVALAAWLSHAYPVYSLPLLIFVLVGAGAVSAGILRDVRRLGLAVETKSAEDISHTVPLVTNYDALSLETYQATKEIIERFYRHSQQLQPPLNLTDNLVVGCRPAWERHHAKPYLDLTPPSENYTIQVGVVVITVSNGRTDIQINPARNVMLDESRRKTEVFLVEDAEHHMTH